MVLAMNFKQVEAFRAVMLTRSMTAAAGLMHTSQPNVSRWIAQLEKKVGFDLFQRSGTRLIPTPEAESFHVEVERAFVGIESLNDSASAIRRRGTGVLRIGAVSSIAQCVLPDAIQAFRQAYPDVPVVVNTGGSDDVARWAATGYSDIGFCSFPTDIASVKFERINTARGVAIVGHTHRLAARKLLKPADFAQEHFISLPAGSLNRLEVDRLFRAGQRMLSIETLHATTICTLVAKGLGVSIVNPVVARALALPDVREIPFSARVEFHSYAVTADPFPVSMLAARMVDSVRLAFKALSAGA